VPPPPAAAARAVPGPSFSCDRDLTEVETTICNSQELSRLDRELANAFEAAQRLAGRKALLRKQQNLWQMAVRDKCEDDSCIRQAYESRFREVMSGKY